jgi:hypothetical protein
VNLVRVRVVGSLVELVQILQNVVQLLGRGVVNERHVVRGGRIVIHILKMIDMLMMMMMMMIILVVVMLMIHVLIGTGRTQVEAERFGLRIKLLLLLLRQGHEFNHMLIRMDKLWTVIEVYMLLLLFTWLLLLL